MEDIVMTTDQEAQELQEDVITVPQFQVIIFLVGDEYFALKINFTQEILLPQEIRSVPRTPPLIKGIMNLRGKIVTVINLSNLFNLREKSPDEETKIIILPFTETTRLGLWVDRIIGIKFFPEDKLEKTSNILINKIGQTELVSSALNDNGVIINLLNPSQFMLYLENYIF